MRGPSLTQHESGLPEEADRVWFDNGPCGESYFLFQGVPVLPSTRHIPSGEENPDLRTPAAAAKALGIDEATLDERRLAGRYFAVPGKPGPLMYPSWQYEDLKSEERLWFENAVLMMHSAGVDPYEAYLCMLCSHDALDRLSPVAYLLKHRDERAANRILDIIRGEFEIS